MGRLCARLAWRKTRMLLHWLHNMLAFSGGTGGGRLGWLSDHVGRGGPCDLTPYLLCATVSLMHCKHLRLARTVYLHRT